MKDFRVMVWGHEREKKVSTGYEKGTDTGNGHIWRRFIVSGASHSNLITATAQSWAWHSHINFSFGIQQNHCCSFKPRAGEVISLSFWEKSIPELYLYGMLLAASAFNLSHERHFFFFFFKLAGKV